MFPVQQGGQYTERILIYLLVLSQTRMNTFFRDTGDPVRDPLYCKVRDATNRYERKARRLTERMWATCRQFIEENAPERAIKDDFYAVWWELFLAYSLYGAGIGLVPTSQRPRIGKGRPDLLTVNPRIWIEAVMPKAGTGADALTEPPIGEVYSVPTEPFVLRLQTAIQEKSSKLKQYLEDGTIQPGEATIIAVSGARLPFRFTEQEIPRIVRAVCAVGSLVVEIDLATRKHVGTSVEYRDHIIKKSNAPVTTDFFLQKQSAHVSAVLYSASDCVNYPRKPGVDFILVHNPNAAVAVADAWLPIGEQHWIQGRELRRSAATAPDKSA